MKVDRCKIVNVCLFTLVFTVFITTFEIPAFAQSRGTYPIDRRIEEINRQGREYERDRLNRELNGKNPKPVDSKLSQAEKKKIVEDFTALQNSYNKAVVNLQSGETIDRRFVLETTADIKKYAARLKESLALPEPQKNASEETNKEIDLDNRRKSLFALCQHIFNFITNPIFNEPIGLDIVQAAKAKRELYEIIELSNKIIETTEKQPN